MGMKKIILKDFSASWTINELGINYLGKKEFKKAEKCFNRSIKMDMYSARPYVLRGLSNASLGKEKLALKDFNKVINTPILRNKKLILSEAFRFKGDIYMKKNLLEESKKEYDSALYHNPNSKVAKLQLEKLMVKSARLN